MYFSGKWPRIMIPKVLRQLSIYERFENYKSFFRYFYKHLRQPPSAPKVLCGVPPLNLRTEVLPTPKLPKVRLAYFWPTLRAKPRMRTP